MIWRSDSMAELLGSGSFPRPFRHLPLPYKAPHSHRETNDSIDGETSEGKAEKERKLRGTNEGRGEAERKIS